MRFAIKYKIENTEKGFIENIFRNLKRALMNTIFNYGSIGTEINEEFKDGFEIRLIIDVDKEIPYQRTLFKNVFSH